MALKDISIKDEKRGTPEAIKVPANYVSIIISSTPSLLCTLYSTHTHNSMEQTSRPFKGIFSYNF